MGLSSWYKNWLLLRSCGEQTLIRLLVRLTECFLCFKSWTTSLYLYNLAVLVQVDQTTGWMNSTNKQVPEINILFLKALVDYLNVYLRARKTCLEQRKKNKRHVALDCARIDWNDFSSLENRFSFCWINTKFSFRRVFYCILVSGVEWKLPNSFGESLSILTISIKSLETVVQ